MGPVVSKLTRRIRRFNVENRAHRELDKEKRPAAPRHPSTSEIIDNLIKESPEILNEGSKDASLDNRLKQVFVSSEITKIEPQESSKRKLPQSRTVYEPSEYGIEEPVTIPHGRYSLRQAIKFIADHQQNPEVWTVSALASEYKISEDVMRNILEYFKTFDLYIPDKTKKSEQFIANHNKETQHIQEK